MPKKFIFVFPFVFLVTSWGGTNHSSQKKSISKKVELKHYSNDGKTNWKDNRSNWHHNHNLKKTNYHHKKSNHYNYWSKRNDYKRHCSYLNKD